MFVGLFVFFSSSGYQLVSCSPLFFCFSTHAVYLCMWVAPVVGTCVHPASLSTNYLDSAYHPSVSSYALVPVCTNVFGCTSNESTLLVVGSTSCAHYGSHICVDNQCIRLCSRQGMAPYVCVVVVVGFMYSIAHKQKCTIFVFVANSVAKTVSFGSSHYGGTHEYGSNQYG